MSPLGWGMSARWSGPAAAATATGTASASGSGSRSSRGARISATETVTERMALARSRIQSLVGNRTVTVFSSTSGCCMAHVIVALLKRLGVIHIAEYHLAGEPLSREMATVLAHMLSSATSTPTPTPVLFVGGRLIGGVDGVIALHIDGSLMTLLTDAGAFRP